MAQVKACAMECYIPVTGQTHKEQNFRNSHHDFSSYHIEERLSISLHVQQIVPFWCIHAGGTGIVTRSAEKTHVSSKKQGLSLREALLRFWNF